MLDRFAKNQAAAFRAAVTTKRTLLDSSINYMKTMRGWETAYFNDGGPGDKLLESHGLREIAIRNKAFAVKGLRIIFIDRAAKNKAHSYLHEVAHIVLKHDFDALTLENEAEANEFADYLLKPHFSKSQIFTFIVTLSLGASLILHIPGIVHPGVAQAIPTSSHTMIHVDESSSDTVVITSSGAKYHKPGCTYVQNKTNIQELTREKAELLGKEPCAICKP